MPALILMYHDLAREPCSIVPGHLPYVLHPVTFESQMQSVASQAFPVITVADWCASSRPERAIVISFDDGHRSNCEFALPILLEQKIKATFFITAGRIGIGESMNWQEIRQLYGAGMEIGSHTVTHRPPSTLDDAALRFELRESRRILEDGLGAPVTSVSSPTGFFNPRMRTIAQEVGYRALCFGQAGLAANDGDPFSLKRVAIKRAMLDEDFDALLRFDNWTIRRIRLKQELRDLARRALGVNTYLGIRRFLTSRGYSS